MPAGGAKANASFDSLEPGDEMPPRVISLDGAFVAAHAREIDMNAPSVTFTGPGGFKYSSKVRDKNALAKVKVGDKVDITWTEATTVSIEDAK